MSNNLISFGQALWQSGIAPALLMLVIGLLVAHYKGNTPTTQLLNMAYKAVVWAEDEFSGGAEQKAQAVKLITEQLMKLDKAHLFTAKQIDDAIEWAVTQMKRGLK